MLNSQFCRNIGTSGACTHAAAQVLDYLIRPGPDLVYDSYYQSSNFLKHSDTETSLEATV